MKHKLELALVVPVFNEEKIIKEVIKKWLNALKKIDFKIIIVNDGSSDNSKKIIKSIVTNKIILLNKKNSGHGPSITYGYKTALGLKPEFIFQVEKYSSESLLETKTFNCIIIVMKCFKHYLNLLGCLHLQYHQIM